MLWSKRIILFTSALFVVISVMGALVFLWPTIEHRSVVGEGKSCEKVSEQNGAQTECLENIVLNQLRRHGIDAAFRSFGYLYEAYPAFGATGCHRHAHRVGDAAYYELYVARGLKLDDIAFPQETTTCGYGFFHGFIEHLIQDHPDEKFVVETCESLRQRLASTMRDIGTICYHASGHGFMQAEVDTLKKSDWGNVEGIADEPLQRCESLPTIAAEIEDCREGVFNVVADWMNLTDFGLFYDNTNPLGPCMALPEKWHWPCVAELAQRTSPLTGTSPIKAYEVASEIAEGELRLLSFSVMIAAMMDTQAPLDRFQTVMSECPQIPEEKMYHQCVSDVARGMLEHGDPGKEYEKVLLVCENPSIKMSGGDAVCYRTLVRTLSRFYDKRKQETICAKLPEVFRAECFAPLAQ